MKYVSTRGFAPPLGFEAALLAGLAEDGGLYVPETYPQLSAPQIADLAGLPYAEAAFRIMRPFVGDALLDQELKDILIDSYAGFAHSAIAPLRQIGPSLWLLELFHGPTLAFKDIAMQALARMMHRALGQKRAHATLIGATSGDTGSAAIEAFRGLPSVDVFILHPEGRVTDVQRRQMTTVRDGNVHNIAVQGTFDDCQALVKQLFADPALRQRLNLAGVNSINWARVLPQVVYYFTAAVALGAPARPVTFSVPTGNFGDIFAGYVARRMGLPIRRLVIATNENDILARALATGRYEPRGVVATSSPSMDIQVASNFERMMFELGGRSSARIRSLRDQLRVEGAFQLEAAEREGLAQMFAAHRIDEHQTRSTIAALARDCGIVVDPHSAVGIAAGRNELGDGSTPVVALATAHPAKFAGVVEAAIGRPVEVPKRLAERLGSEERFDVLPNAPERLSAYILDHVRDGVEWAR